MKTKIKIYEAAKKICQNIQDKLNSDDYLVIMDYEILNKYVTFTPTFRFNDEDHSIEFRTDQFISIDLIAPDDYEDTYQSVSEMKQDFKQIFKYVKLTNLKSF